MTAPKGTRKRQGSAGEGTTPGGTIAELAADRLDNHEPSSDLKTAVGQEVRFWRNLRGLTGARLAKMSGVSAGMLTKIEKGDVAPSIRVLRREPEDQAATPRITDASLPAALIHCGSSASITAL